jgi:hypothetical protein
VIDGGLVDFEKQWICEKGINLIPLPDLTQLYGVVVDDIQTGYMARPFLPVLLNADPEDVIVWMDADTWVQNPTALKWFIEGASDGQSILAVPEVDRIIAYNSHHREVTSNFTLNGYLKFFGRDAEPLCSLPMINNGVFSCRADHRFWEDWQSSCMYALTYNHCAPDFGIDQISFNCLV